MGTYLNTWINMSFQTFLLWNMRFLFFIIFLWSLHKKLKVMFQI